jgi:hypothetical protein
MIATCIAGINKKLKSTGTVDHLHYHLWVLPGAWQWKMKTDSSTILIEKGYFAIQVLYTFFHIAQPISEF